MHLSSIWHIKTKHQANHPPRPAQPGEKLWNGNFITICLVNFLLLTGGNMLVTVFPLYIVTLGGDEVTVGLAASIYAVMALLMRPIAGWLLDTRSRRVIFFIGLAGTALIPPLYLLLPFLTWTILLRALHGSVWSAAGTSATTNACDILPQEHFGEGMGVFGLTNSLSMVIGPALGLLIWTNFDTTPLFFGLSASSLLALLMLTRFRFSPVLPAARRRFRGHVPLYRRVFHLFDKRALPAALVLFCCCLPGGAVASFIVLYTETSGVANGGIYFTCQAIGATVSRVFAGKACDKYGEGPSIYAACISFAAGMATIIFADQSSWFYFGAFLYGIGYGVSLPAFQSMSVRTVPPERRGAASSTYLCSMDISMGFGGLIGGFLVKAVGYHLMFGLMSVGFFVCAAVYYFWASKTPSAFKVWKTSQKAAKTA